MSDILIGRERECATLSRLINQKKNIIIYGLEGTGKSAVINKVLGDFSNLKKFYSPSSKTLKEALLNFMLYGFFDKKTIQKADTLILKKLFYEIIARNRPEYIIFDQVESVEPKYYNFFVYLLDEKIPFIILSRGLEKKDIGHLRMAMFNFEKIEITDFDRIASDILIDHFIKEYEIKITNGPEFKKQIFYFSKGNAKIIKQLCFLARDVKYQKSGSLDVKLMDLDRRIDEVVH